MGWVGMPCKDIYALTSSTCHNTHKQTNKHKLFFNNTMTQLALECQRHMFDLDDSDTPVAYLNACSCSPIPTQVHEAASQALAAKRKPWTMDTSTSSETHVKRIYAKLLSNSSAVSEQDIALCPSTSYAMTLAANSVNWAMHANPTVVVLDQQFASNTMPWQHHAKLRIVQRRRGRNWTDGVLEELANDDVACVAIPHAHWTDGSTVDVRAVAEACKAKSIPLALDLTQTLGAAPIAIGPDSVDATFVACSVHKHLYAPYGASLLYVARRHQAHMRRLEFHERQVRDWPDFDAKGASLFDASTGGYPTESWTDMRKADAGGRPNPTLMPALHASLELVVGWDPRRISEYVAPLSQLVEDAAIDVGLSVARPRVAHIVGIHTPSGSHLPSALELGAELKKRGVLVSVRCGVLRVSFGVFNTVEEARMCASVLREVCVAS